MPSAGLKIFILKLFLCCYLSTAYSVISVRYSLGPRQKRRQLHNARPQTTATLMTEYVEGDSEEKSFKDENLKPQYLSIPHPASFFADFILVFS